MSICDKGDRSHPALTVCSLSSPASERLQHTGVISRVVLGDRSHAALTVCSLSPQLQNGSSTPELSPVSSSVTVPTPP